MSKNADKPKPTEKTMQFQDELPPLPLPSLEQTIEAYIKSCEPLLSASELEHTKGVCHDFLNGIGPQLHSILEERASSEKNWIEEWWETFAYLKPRYPSAININWYGVVPGNWGPREMSQCEAAAIFTVALLQYRKEFLAEAIPPEKMMGKPLCMYQYTRFFNSCVIPGEDVDEIQVYDHNQRHIVVLRNNCMWAIDVMDENGKTTPLPELVNQFEAIRAEATGIFDLERYPPVSVLTSENRTNWAKARNYLVQLDPCNKESLEIIEKALFLVALDETSPANSEEVARNCLLGDGRNRWYDKPVVLVVHENARTGINGQHMWADALVVVRIFAYCAKYVNDNFKQNFSQKTVVGTPTHKPRRLRWKIDNNALTAIECASAAVSKLIQASDLSTLLFQHYGHAFLKRYKLSPDYFIQEAIQLAYYKMYKHVPAVYETAHTRLFHHGRTETVRSLTNESLAFVKTMESSADASTKWEALQTAMKRHGEVIKNSLLGQGIDRHLMGLYIVSEMSGITPRPAIFTDKAYELSKRYRISSSNISGTVGASPIWGGFSAMYDDGYGICYALQPDRINFSITAYHTDPTTSAEKFKRHLEHALLDMVELCLSRNVIYVGSSNL
ncbi:Aste57867_20120 [Aphanomyces stellatus]|uniref:Aste57867_20120 protein n=1 Tax=Aphanomyces stellatus TaxID=120398 RepID=A0A485LFS1_9STRA|nr:hypothetical protein As57867_020054 [Aphanomyces stellatus]VFT96815.1 Aste57867_20120 [Aphanomyces stellatus]